MFFTTFEGEKKMKKFFLNIVIIILITIVYRAIYEYWIAL